MDPMLHIIPGVYEHYNGHSYLVHHMSTHTETEEELVNYQPLYPPPPGRHIMQSRPAKMWNEIVSVCHNCRRKEEDCPCPAVHQQIRPTRRFTFIRPS